VTHIEQITILDPDGQPIFPEVKDSVHEISDPKQRIMALKTIICILAVLQKTAAEIFCETKTNNQQHT
jgi:hypothetical protein